MCNSIQPSPITVGLDEIPFAEEFLSPIEGYILPAVESIAFHVENDTTVVRWLDGTKTVVRRGEGEPYSEYSAFAAAVAKKVFGSTAAVKKVIETYDVKRVAERREAEKLAERRRQDAAAARNRDRRIRHLAKLMEEMNEASILLASGGMVDDPDGGGEEANG